jgi:hypothetical protein
MSVCLCNLTLVGATTFFYVHQILLYFSLKLWSSYWQRRVWSLPRFLDIRQFQSDLGRAENMSLISPFFLMHLGFNASHRNQVSFAGPYHIQVPPKGTRGYWWGIN